SILETESGNRLFELRDVKHEVSDTVEEAEEGDLASIFQVGEGTAVSPHQPRVVAVRTGRLETPERQEAAFAVSKLLLDPGFVMALVRHPIEGIAGKGH